jgi:hypothetical protein
MSDERSTSLDALLVAAHRRIAESEERRLAREEVRCIPLSRALALAFRISQASDDERGHAEECHRCRTRLEGFRRESHPTLWQLAAAELGALDALDRPLVEAHLAVGCPECSERFGVGAIRDLVGAVRAGTEALTEVRALLEQAVESVVPMPALARFGGEDSSSERFEVEQMCWPIEVVVRQAPGNQLQVHAGTGDGVWRGRTACVVVLGATPTPVQAIVTFSEAPEDPGYFRGLATVPCPEAWGKPAGGPVRIQVIPTSK